jgi:hypothetical protein
MPAVPGLALFTQLGRGTPLTLRVDRGCTSPPMVGPARPTPPWRQRTRVDLAPGCWSPPHRRDGHDSSRRGRRRTSAPAPRLRKHGGADAHRHESASRTRRKDAWQHPYARSTGAKQERSLHVRHWPSPACEPRKRMTVTEGSAWWSVTHVGGRLGSKLPTPPDVRGVPRPPRRAILLVSHTCAEPNVAGSRDVTRTCRSA